MSEGYDEQLAESEEEESLDDGILKDELEEIMDG